MEQLKKAINGYKVQDSSTPSKLAATLKKIGYNLSGESSFYILHDDTAFSVDAQMFAAVNNNEILACELYREVAAVEAESVEYTNGDILTFTATDGVKLTFVFLREYDGKTVLGHGQLRDGSIADVPHRYIKARCRKANASEISHFHKICKDYGWKVTATDGVVSIKPCRTLNATYYTVTFDFNEMSYKVLACTEEGDLIDTRRFNTGNYFDTKEQAEYAVKELIKNAKSL